MKAWYDDIDAATLQRIKTYSAFNDPESKNLMIQTMYEYKQEENAELKHTIATVRQEKDNVSMHAKAMEVVAKTRSDQLTKAKDHIKKLLGCLQQDTNDPQTNYYVVKYMTEAEQFLKDSEVEK